MSLRLDQAFDWQKHFPYEEPREIQAQVLTLLAAEWDNYDVFILKAPTAFGKTAVARTLMNAHYRVSVLAPTNLLVDQYLDEFPDTPTLSRMDSYYCEEWKRPCPVTRNKLLQFCKGCSCSKDLATAKFRKGPGIYNYHTYLAHKLYRDVLVVDEAHNLIPVIRDRLALLIWQHDYKYPNNMYSLEQMQEWINSLPDNVRKHKKMQTLIQALFSRSPEYVVQRSRESFNGKGTLRGQPEDRDCLKLLPVDITNAPPIFWPTEVKKIVLMSATISHKDVEALGIGGRRRVCYIDCKSPIPSGNRPIVIEPIVSVNRNNMEESGEKLARYIEEIAAAHVGEKGVIHATYQMAGILINHLTDSRYLFHDRSNKKEQYRFFRESRSESGRILVACGMYEGIDLPEDLGRWQIISKIPWQSLGSPAVRHLSEVDPEWYVWETMKTVIQACGRICRTPDDFGVSYCPDATFWNMYDKGRHLVPEWFSDAIIDTRKFTNE